MSSTLMFAPAFKPSQASKHIKEHLRSRSKKRKRGSTDDTSDVCLDVADNVEDVDWHGQLRDEYSSGPDQFSFEELGNEEDLAYDKSKSHTTGLRKQHLAALMAVLHRCLMEGDYLRAGRAWGMLLRAETYGHTMDVRTYGRWGIGAEILLFRDAQRFQQHHPQADGAEASNDQSAADYLQATLDPSSLFSIEGFRKARGYYERLILQYPYRKTMPNAVSSLDFYPAMFSLWIYAVQSEHTAMLSNPGASGPDVGSDGVGEDQEIRIRHATCRTASEIATHLDELLVSPPYSDQASLWRLRGMVDLWIADLLREGDAIESTFEKEDTSTSDGSPTSSLHVGLNRSTEENHRHSRLQAKSRAHEAFQHASRLGVKLDLPV